MDLSEFKERSSANAAVIVLYERASDSLILTKRRENLRAHPGEVCFPGGTWEEGDQDLYATGLRELYEELGIAGDRVSLIRALEPQSTLLGKVIQPWFAQIESINPYQINPEEVARLIMVPMPLVQAAKNYKDVVVERGRFRFKSCEFVYNDDWVWGATAKIMKQLIIEP
ncbi:MAG: putative Nudix hydrolase NudL [Legionella sp.]|uniref:NUDIX hydrolase n=1 Tax=Legionella sp. TaxID=459 RepID=UPI003D13EA54